MFVPCKQRCCKLQLKQTVCIKIEITERRKKNKRKQIGDKKKPSYNFFLKSQSDECLYFSRKQKNQAKAKLETEIFA